MVIDSLWGEEFDIPEKEEKTKKILDKISKPKELKVTAEKRVRDKNIPLSDKLAVIKEEVYRILGKQEQNIIVIRDLDTFHSYIDKAITVGRIAIDTETNNSLDPITCKLMGLCLYVPGQKQAYIPVNHVKDESNELLDNQITENQIKEELTRLLNNNLEIIMHNGKFDYQVLKCTCGVEIPPTWDTMIGAKLLDENEKAGLKEQYIAKIDPDQEKYSIEKLFSNIEYKYVDPDLFALYAATDALMTDKLYLYQQKQFEDPSLSKVLSLAKNLEMPLIQALAEMELAGMAVDQEYAILLSNKYNNELKDIDEKLSAELTKLKPQIDAWRLTADANARPKKKTGEGEGKSKSEQLEDPVNMGSPTQLAILFYDILGCPQVSKKSPRGTGEKELEAIGEKLKTPICKLLLERREKVKLISTYIETIPAIAKKWPDGRVRTHFSAYGADTGRLSSGGRIVFGLNDEWGGINFQNIPSHEKRIRLLFKAHSEDKNIYMSNNKLVVRRFSSVNTPSGFMYIDKLTRNDIILLSDDLGNNFEYQIISIEESGDLYTLNICRV